MTDLDDIPGLFIPTTEPVVQERARRFWSSVAIGPDCWEWTGSRLTRGYGKFIWDKGQSVLAHRASWALLHGPIPDGMVIMHACDNPPCVKPSHLLLGSQADNQADMARKGRAASGDRNGSRRYPERRPRLGHSAPGEANSQAKLTADAVRDIRTSSLAGIDLAARYGVSKSTVSRIKAGKRWTHV